MLKKPSSKDGGFLFVTEYLNTLTLSGVIHNCVYLSWFFLEIGTIQFGKPSSVMVGVFHLWQPQRMFSA